MTGSRHRQAGLLKFLARVFTLDGHFIPLVTLRQGRSRARERVLPLAGWDVIGAFDACFSIGVVVLATRIDRVGEAAALRGTLTVNAALIG